MARLIEHMLRKQPAERPQSALLVAEQLKALRERLYPGHALGRPDGMRLGDSGELTGRIVD